jgi:hypothetical protein
MSCLLFAVPDIDVRQASKVFGQKFSCGSSVPTAGDDEIVIQGDVVDDLINFITEKWPEVSICHKLHVAPSWDLHSGAADLTSAVLQKSVLRARGTTRKIYGQAAQTGSIVRGQL